MPSRPGRTCIFLLVLVGFSFWEPLWQASTPWRSVVSFAQSPSQQPSGATAEAERLRLETEQKERDRLIRENWSKIAKGGIIVLSLFVACLCNWLLTRWRFSNPWVRLFLSVLFGALLSSALATVVVEAILGQSLLVAAGLHGAEVMYRSAALLLAASALVLLGNMIAEHFRKD